MAARIQNVIAHATREGMMVKCGQHYHYGAATVERFNVEEIAPGEAPVLLPKRGGLVDPRCPLPPQHRLTLADVRRIIRLTLTEKDASEDTEGDA